MVSSCFLVSRFFCLVDRSVVVRTGLIGVLDDLEHFAKSTGDAAAMSSVKEARVSLERLIGKMDGIESGFDRIAERSRETGKYMMPIQLLTSLHSVVRFLVGITSKAEYVGFVACGR